MIMGPSQAMSPYAIPSITISPPTSPREGVYQKRGASSDLATIDEADPSTTDGPCGLWTATSLCSPSNLLSPEYTPPSAPCGGEKSSEHEDELAKLKSMATRLRLSTRRPSYVEWCANLPKLRDLNGNLTAKKRCQDRSDDWRTFKQRRDCLEEKIQWVRNELIEMKSQDHRLAIQLMRLRSEIQQLRLQKSCHEHRELIDTATECAQEDRDSQLQPALCDPPFRGNGVLLALEKPLKDVGVTRLNLFARRFSLC
ncbi:protein FAM167A-like isoform X2 [Acanthaster planci]|nr:protein FAM167A-like isoform X2 [Acanthaster planci]XP_022083280.1 protein FAM167A-like isoform X2 [Acanthaster planci]XP_022083281.1 protein FAM167A-like isoform X2 [Acanthaster planci]XP_022083282.1 protein FAM167A-like isoform X2 [Acanthaster planci]XP_022083283.1 protein FAM167A-like isoform X2 [Acanthaster planci]XP_022083284.1 protein FAM167A-like isoform X2 [Acanthaster planci]XP_022083285.1 protein FAM167A-like isoform X2 [Acanthaster planci]XP_022083286.1 protein FAM167A-like iso